MPLRSGKRGCDPIRTPCLQTTQAGGEVRGRDGSSLCAGPGEQHRTPDSRVNMTGQPPSTTMTA